MKILQDLPDGRRRKVHQDISAEDDVDRLVIENSGVDVFHEVEGRELNHLHNFRQDLEVTIWCGMKILGFEPRRRVAERPGSKDSRPGLAQERWIDVSGQNSDVAILEIGDCTSECNCDGVSFFAGAAASAPDSQGHFGGAIEKCGDDVLGEEGEMIGFSKKVGFANGQMERERIKLTRGKSGASGQPIGATDYVIAKTQDSCCRCDTAH